jgi:hypothetical protein
MALVAETCWGVDDVRFDMKLGGDDLDGPPQRQNLTAPDIEDLPLPRAFESLHGGLDAIGDKRTRTGLLAVTEDGDRVTSAERLDETVIRHIRSLTRPVDREVARHDDGKAVRIPVREQEMLGGQFRDPTR